VAVVVVQEYQKESKVVPRSLPVGLNIKRGKVGCKKKIENEQEGEHFYKKIEKGGKIEREEKSREEKRRGEGSCGCRGDVWR
jgi:hypothetical protein